jgi:hypothetical protein
VSRSLDGLRPGRRTVEVLIVKHLTADTAQGLRPLREFPDLRALELEWPADIDLEPLAELPIESLNIEYGQQLDLAPLARMPSLHQLSINDPRGCVVPRRWELGPPLRSLDLMVERPAGAFLRDAVAAIPWGDLTSLESLAVMGESNLLDLGFLAEVPWLTALEIRGLRHGGDGPSPLEPPFPSLPLDVAVGLNEVDDANEVRAAWAEHRRNSGRTGPTIQFRDLRWDGGDEHITRAEGDGWWGILPPAKEGGVWHTYGSLYFAAEGRDGDTEYDALQAAERRLRDADPALLKRLDFDQEADGTGIAATTREDLETALRILKLPAG